MKSDCLEPFLQEIETILILCRRSIKIDFKDEIWSYTFENGYISYTGKSRESALINLLNSNYKNLPSCLKKQLKKIKYTKKQKARFYK